ncbi:MAG: DUF4263 domain-containing protein [Clostridia bacterium]|nr:DUF4263 domain-containing protein [Clostridia bacterium]
MINFKIENEVLLLIYYPLTNEWIEEKLEQKEPFTIKNTFTVVQQYHKDFTDEDFIGDQYIFEIGKVVGEFIKLNNDVFSITHNIYFSKDIKFDEKLFVAYRNISIIEHIDKNISTDIYITSELVNNPRNYIPLQIYKSLISTFPNTTELTKYANVRIANILKDFCDGLGNIKEDYENYLNKRGKNIVPRQIIINELKRDFFKKAYEELKEMLKNPEAYIESNWQEKILEIILLLYPKYILAKREVFIGSDGRHKKKPDFLLIDSSGFVDVLEIKKPGSQHTMTPTEYRYNYIADREFSGAIVQIEKYIYCLNHGGEKLEKDLNSKLGALLPEQITVTVNNPQGMLLMGRSDKMASDQLFDFEVIKRQHKNIVDIMTYDDLLQRLKNINLMLS